MFFCEKIITNTISSAQKNGATYWSLKQINKICLFSKIQKDIVKSIFFNIENVLKVVFYQNKWVICLLTNTFPTIRKPDILLLGQLMLA